MGTLVERPLRDALRMVSPGPVVLLSTYHRGQPNLMTAAWVRPQSLGPTLLSVAIHHARLTHQFASATEQIVISFPVYDMMSTVHRAGLVSGHDGDKFAALELEPIEAEVSEAPRVDGCVAYIECEVRDRQSGGDHDLFLLAPVFVAADDEAFAGFWQVTSDAGRLLHHLGADRYAGLSQPYQITIDEADEER